MSHPGKFVKKHPWEAAGAAAALGLGGAGLAGMGPLAGLLGAGEGAAAAVPEAGAALAGASGLADLAGATGAPLASTPSVSSPFFSGAGGMDRLKAGLKGASAAKGLLAPQEAPPPPMGMAPTPVTPPTPTILPTMSGVGAAAPPGVDPAKWAAFQQWQQQHPFGANT